MGMTTLLTLIAMFGATRKDAPKVSYVSYLDVWMLACIIFVFGSMVEFIMVQRLLKASQRKKAERLECSMRVMLALVVVGFTVIYWIKLLRA